MRYIIINRRIGEQAYASWGFPVFYAARSLREFIREIIMKDEGKELILLHTDPTRASNHFGFRCIFSPVLRLTLFSPARLLFQLSNCLYILYTFTASKIHRNFVL